MNAPTRDDVETDSEWSDRIQEFENHEIMEGEAKADREFEDRAFETDRKIRAEKERIARALERGPSSAKLHGQLLFFLFIGEQIGTLKRIGADVTALETQLAERQMKA